MAQEVVYPDDRAADKKQNDNLLRALSVVVADKNTDIEATMKKSAEKIKKFTKSSRQSLWAFCHLQVAMQNLWLPPQSVNSGDKEARQMEFNAPICAPKPRIEQHFHTKKYQKTPIFGQKMLKNGRFWSRRRDLKPTKVLRYTIYSVL